MREPKIGRARLSLATFTPVLFTLSTGFALHCGGGDDAAPPVATSVESGSGWVSVTTAAARGADTLAVDDYTVDGARAVLAFREGTVGRTATAPLAGGVAELADQVSPTSADPILARGRFFGGSQLYAYVVTQPAGDPKATLRMQTAGGALVSAESEAYAGTGVGVGADGAMYWFGVRGAEQRSGTVIEPFAHVTPKDGSVFELVSSDVSTKRDVRYWDVRLGFVGDVAHIACLASTGDVRMFRFEAADKRWSVVDSINVAAQYGRAQLSWPRGDGLPQLIVRQGREVRVVTFDAGLRQRGTYDIPTDGEMSFAAGESGAYVGFSDASQGGRATVLSLAAAEPKLVGKAGFSRFETVPRLFVKQGQLVAVLRKATIGSPEELHVVKSASP